MGRMERLSPSDQGETGVGRVVGAFENSFSPMTEIRMAQKKVATEAKHSGAYFI